MENVEKKLPVKNLERIAEKCGFNTFEQADAWRKGHQHPGQTKVKVFARWTGTYDVVFYGPIKANVEEAKVEEKKVQEPKVHGLTAKERRSAQKKKDK